MVYYPLCLHLQAAFAPLGHKKGDFPLSEAAQEDVLSLPIYPELAEAQAGEVVQTIQEYFKR